MAQTKARAGSADGSRSASFVDAAAKLIARQGYDRTSVRDIAEAMNLTSGSIFYHFKNKHDLLEAIIHKGISDGLALMRPMLKAEQPPLTRLRALIGGHLKIMHGDLRHFHRVWNQEWSRLDADAQTRLRQLNEEYRQYWRDTLVALQQAGYLRSDPDVARHLLVAGLNWTSTWARVTDRQTREALEEQICAAVLNWSADDFRTAEQGEKQPAPRAGARKR